MSCQGSCVGIEKSRAKTVESPWFGFITGAHIPETFKATLNDAFGLRERFTVSFAEPQWLTIRPIREAVRDTARADAQASRFRCYFVVPALQVVGVAQGTKLPGFHRGKFDGHMELQRQSFLRPGRHQESK